MLRVRQSSLPQTELPDGEYLASKGNGTQILRDDLVKCLRGRDHGKRRDYPADGIDLIFVQEFHQLDREHEQ